MDICASISNLIFNYLSLYFNFNYIFEMSYITFWQSFETKLTTFPAPPLILDKTSDFLNICTIRADFTCIPNFPLREYSWWMEIEARIEDKKYPIAYKWPSVPFGDSDRTYWMVCLSSQYAPNHSAQAQVIFHIPLTMNTRPYARNNARPILGSLENFSF